MYWLRSRLKVSSGADCCDSLEVWERGAVAAARPDCNLRVAENGLGVRVRLQACHAHVEASTDRHTEVMQVHIISEM